MKTRLFSVAFISILLVVVLSGFVLAAGGEVLSFSSRLWSPPAEQEFIIEYVIKPFEKENNCTVNFQILDDIKLLERAELQLKTDHPTMDIVCAYVANMPEWIENGYIEDLTPYVESWDDRTFSPTFEYGTNFEGKQYFVPVGADVYLTIANKKALEYLPSGADLDKLTWEDFAKWSNAIAKGEGEGKTVVTGIPMKSLVYQFGAISLSYGATFPDVNTPEAIKAWEIFVSMKDDFIPAVLNVDNCVDPMKREEAWLSWMHCARAGQVYSANPANFVVAPVPEGPAGIGSIAGVSGYGVLKNAPHKELAIKFLEYITRPDMQVKIAKGTGGFIPPVEEALNYLGDDPEDEVVAKAVMVLSKGNVSGIPGGDFQDWGAVKKVFDDVFVEMVLNGDGTVDEARLNQAKAELDAIRK
ncbi:sugar ABC transporter substrate-binding protein [Candidatus Atribacteria bacterium HGW-Atribacteria-1]|nr:MAG: sugar ABC transporter substrate-binding protein [Candidatus Atribacteria bacterium HGW-Atribacteria-1]